MDLQTNLTKPLIVLLICTAQASSNGKRSCSQKKPSFQVPNCHVLSNRDLKSFHTCGLSSTNKKPYCLQKVIPAWRSYGRGLSPVNMKANSVKGLSGRSTLSQVTAGRQAHPPGGLSGRSNPPQVTAGSPGRQARRWTSKSRRPCPPLTNSVSRRKSESIRIADKINCDRCGLATQDQISLILHRRPTHSELSAVACQVCEKVFTSTTDLHKHIKDDHTIGTDPTGDSTHRGWKPFACLTCDEKNDYRSNLKKPLRAQTDKRPTHCLIGLYAYQEDHQLTSHVRINTKVKPHQCEYCGHKIESKPDSKTQGGTNQNIFFNCTLLRHAIVLAHLLPGIFLNFHANVLSKQLPEPGHTQRTPRPPGRGSQATVLLLMPFTIS